MIFCSNNESYFERIVMNEKIFNKMSDSAYAVEQCTKPVKCFKKPLFASLRLCVITFFFSLKTFAQLSAPSKDSLKKDIVGALRYLAQTQCQQTIVGKEYAGEWPAYMQMHTRFVLLGTRHKYRDSNSFTTVGVYNLLSEIYLADTSLRQILPMLKAAYPEIQTYATTQQFNFWKKLPPNRDLRKGAEPVPVPLVRRPTHYKLNSRYINNAANVENDADDTASGNLAIWFHNRIFQKSDSLVTANLFDTYLDENRNNRHWYNYLFNGCAHSGGYMTWLGKEANFKRWNIFKTIGHNQIFFTKRSVCYPMPYQPYIPYGTNDIDAVVNANILTYLAKKGELAQSKGRIGAHKFIQHQAEYGRWSRAGTYYPNRYHFHYAVSRALIAGDSSLIKTAQLMLKHLQTSQEEDGTYHSRRRVNHRDVIQSSAYALLAMLNFKESGLDVPQKLMEKTLSFILSQKQKEGNGLYWKGGVFFSGGTVVRNVLYFTSDAYTTTLITSALQKYLGIEDRSEKTGVRR